MALIQCPECRQRVSDKAPVCIHCGYPLAAKQPAPAPSKAQPAASGQPKPSWLTVAESEQETFNLTVTHFPFGCNKVEAIRQVRAAFGLGLKEARDLLEGRYSLTGLTEEEAQQAKEILKGIVAVCETKPPQRPAAEKKPLGCLALFTLFYIPFAFLKAFGGDSK